MTSDKIVHPKKAAFIAAYTECGNITQSAECATIARNTHYDWLANDPGYAAEFTEARAIAADALVDEARRRAVQGVGRLKFDSDGAMVMAPMLDENDQIIEGDDGEPVLVPYVEYSRSDTLLIFLIKSLIPETFGDRHRVQVTTDWKAELAGLGLDPVEVERDMRELIKGKVAERKKLMDSENV